MYQWPNPLQTIDPRIRWNFDDSGLKWDHEHHCVENGDWEYMDFSLGVVRDGDEWRDRTLCNGLILMVNMKRYEELDECDAQQLLEQSDDEESE